jgi:hypothetical protein
MWRVEMVEQAELFSEAMERTEKTWLSCQSIQAAEAEEALLLQATVAMGEQAETTVEVVVVAALH